MASKEKKEFDKKRKEISENSSQKDFKHLEILASEIKKTKMLPKYLDVGILVVFLSFGLSSISCVCWLIFGEQVLYEIIIIFSIILSIGGFFVVGIYAISDVFVTMKNELKSVEKEFEEIEKLEQEVHQIKKEYEPKMRVQIEILTYRRRQDKDTWHWCKNCSTYPTEDFVEETVSTGRPSFGELCNECLTKEKAGTCST